MLQPVSLSGPAVILCVLVTGGLAGADDEWPRSVDTRLQVTLFAEDPSIRTPTGIDVDPQGRVWALESNTHFRPDDYDGPETDRLLVFEDPDGNGRADGVTTFATDFTYAMSVAVRPPWIDPVELPGHDDPGRQQVFLATRAEILLLEDLDGDDGCDRRTRLVHLETDGNYPHNGLAGFAFDALGWMYFGFGENLGADYAIIGRDGTRLTGGGEGGNMYRIRPDGTGLTHLATGFWNPHASCVDAFGRLFTVDNDPDSRPPCRLMHVIPGGDFGYRFRNGRKGLHPFTAWNGEIPGTLPMVAGTGEAPSGILAYEHDAFPAEYRGDLLATSWGDHRIDRFRLQPKGASFEAIAEPLIVGGENFRPVGIAMGPDGSLYCTDWVLRDYKLHGRGRVWKISAVRKKSPVDKTTPVNRLRSPVLTERRLAAQELADSPEGRRTLLEFTLQKKESEPVRARIEAYWALQNVATPEIADELRPVIRELRADGSGPVDEVEIAAWWYRNDQKSSRTEAERKGLAPITTAYAGSEAEDSLAHPALLLAKVYNSGGEWPDGPVLTDPSLAEVLADPFLFAMQVQQFARVPDPHQYVRWWEAGPIPEGRLLLTLAQRQRDPHDTSLLERQLSDPYPPVRRAAVQWVAEERLVDFRPQVETVLRSEPMTTELFLATLAALEMLDGKDPKDFDRTPAGNYVLPLLKDESTPAAVRIQALRLVEPNDEGLELALLAKLADSADDGLKTEAVRTLQQSGRPEAVAPLVDIATDDTRPRSLRAEAISGLAGFLGDPTQGTEARSAIVALLERGNGGLRLEAVRALRGQQSLDGDLQTQLVQLAETATTSSEMDDGLPLARQLAMTLQATAADLPEALRKLLQERPTGTQQWLDRLMEFDGGDQEAGRLVFFHPGGPGCAKCHTVNGRGGKVGPDLSNIGRSFTRRKLIESILDPSREVSPQFTNWSVLTDEGRVETGMIVHENLGQTTLGRSDGTLVTIETASIEERTPQRKSVMPEKLAERMTIDEFRDLLAWLQSLGQSPSRMSRE
ncbi:Cytochrome c [Maioricimonas rarisocia]|uniref:Cytochrome c n=1 Tax=Maioricimonas rarisocia TaxID=2528026 RepID=A0A517Z892_9PLAN|nr:PVC-type heme-binding CxxCH protein [Maioricimonas rarisocia]QDU38697.1 Cytochrome c [Maioricimonas rarisocia]